LKAPLGVYAVLGNNDYARPVPALRAALSDAGIGLLRNETIKTGAFSIAGIDDEWTGRDDIAATFAALPAGTIPLVLSHGPDVTPDLPAQAKLVFAGHTHCGQIVFPVIGPLVNMSSHGNRYHCGHIEEAGRHIFVTAGLGTSMLPLRFGAVPDMWLVTLRPER
ncbi:MAG: phosphohydrolase, partial [Pacificimonas sp.]